MTLHGAGFRNRRAMQATRGSSCLLEAWFARYMRRISRVMHRKCTAWTDVFSWTGEALGGVHSLAGGVHPLSGVAHLFYYC